MRGVGKELKRLEETPNNEYNLDVFRIFELTNGFPLSWVAMLLFKRNKLLEEFNISESVMSNYLRAVEVLYRPENPYHNNIHAADVTWSFHYMLHASGLIPQLSKLELFSCILAAVIHDCDHPALSNSFLVQTQHPIALTYNDSSVLENYHCYCGFRAAMSNSSCNIFKSFSRTDMAQLRKIVIFLVLGTDFSKHAAIFSSWEELSARGWPMEEQNDRSLIALLLIKCSDVGHCSKSIFFHKEWSQRISSEFLRQGDYEKELGFVPAPGMDRDKVDEALSQYNFITSSVLPLYQLLADRYPGCKSLLDRVYKNAAHWQDQSNV